MRRLAPILVLSTLALAGLSLRVSPSASAQGTPPDPTRPAPPSAGTSATDPAPMSPEETARRDQVVASIGDVRITLGEIEDEINAMSPFVRARYRDRTRLVEYAQNMIRLELLAREGERRGFGDDPEVRRTTLETAVQYMIRTEIDERITAESIPEGDVLVYYDAHPEEFSRPEMRRASHILLATREEAAALVADARDADMRRFRALAMDRSLDAETRNRGGDLRYFDDRGRGPNASDPGVDPAIVAAAFALGAVGDTSEPIAVGERFSVVKLTGLRPAEHRSVGEAGEAIRMRLFRERRTEALDAMVERLRGSVPTEVHYEAMANLRMEPPPASAVASEHAAEGAEAVGEPEELPVTLDPLRPEPEGSIPGLGEPAGEPAPE